MPVYGKMEVDMNELSELVEVLSSPSFTIPVLICVGRRKRIATLVSSETNQYSRVLWERSGYDVFGSKTLRCEFTGKDSDVVCRVDDCARMERVDDCIQQPALV